MSDIFQPEPRWSRLGNLLLRAQSAPASETAWDTGAAGEEALAAHLAKTCPGVIVLHDRRLPRSRANIDHLAVTPSGVFVIDAKRYKGKIEVRKPFFGHPGLFIAGRNKAKLVEGLVRQEEAVRSALAGAIPEMPVHACFCFLNPERTSRRERDRGLLIERRSRYQHPFNLFCFPFIS